jgi:predicted phosphate transport protein (TIGR00153 family)
MGSIFNKETDFFALFCDGMKYAQTASIQLKTAFKDGSIDAAELSKIKETEHLADRHVHNCLKLIEDAFITPIDRTDIIEIVKEIEDVTDSIDCVANNVYMMRIDTADETAQRLVDLCVDACGKLVEMLSLLKQFKKNLAKISELTVDVNRIEEDGDKLYTSVMRELFGDSSDVLNLIKKKELYNRLEDVLDRCEDVADSIEKIIIAKT